MKVSPTDLLFDESNRPFLARCKLVQVFYLIEKICIGKWLKLFSLRFVGASTLEYFWYYWKVAPPGDFFYCFQIEAIVICIDMRFIKSDVITFIDAIVCFQGHKALCVVVVWNESKCKFLKEVLLLGSKLSLQFIISLNIFFLPVGLFHFCTAKLVNLEIWG